MEPVDITDSQENSPRFEFQQIAIETEEAEGCWVCGNQTLEIHCRIICPNCGFTPDCSDP